MGADAGDERVAELVVVERDVVRDDAERLCCVWRAGVGEEMREEGGGGEEWEGREVGGAGASQPRVLGPVHASNRPCEPGSCVERVGECGRGGGDGAGGGDDAEERGAHLRP